MTSVGTGVAHSEYNGSDKEEVHFLQIWALPKQRGLTPSYSHRHFSDAEKRDRVVTVVAPPGHPGVTEDREGTGPAPVHSDLAMHATILSPGSAVKHTFSPATKRAYVHYITTSYRSPRHEQAQPTLELTAGTTTLKLAEGDGAFVEGSISGAQLQLSNTGTQDAELLIWDLHA